MAPPTGTQTEQGNLSQKRCDLTNVSFGGYLIYIYNIFIRQLGPNSPSSLRF